MFEADLVCVEFYVCPGRRESLDLDFFDVLNRQITLRAYISRPSIFDPAPFHKHHTRALQNLESLVHLLFKPPIDCEALFFCHTVSNLIIIWNSLALSSAAASNLTTYSHHGQPRRRFLVATSGRQTHRCQRETHPDEA